MKCKRCRAFVPDDIDVCPVCGENLTFLRQLLKSFYEEEAGKRGEKGSPEIPPEAEKEIDKIKVEAPVKSEEPRVILNSESPDLGADYRLGFSFEDAPDPEKSYEEALNTTAWEHALRGGFWRRLLAFSVDQFLLFLLTAIFAVAGLIASELGANGISLIKQVQLVAPILFPMSVLLAIVYFSFFHAAWGQTIGKMIFGLRVVRPDGQSLSFLRSLARTLSYPVSALPLFLGFIWVLFNANKRSWHDMISGTMVIREQ